MTAPDSSVALSAAAVGGDPVSRFVVMLVDRVIRSIPALEPFRTIAETIARFAGVGGASSILYAIVVCAAASLLHVHHDLAALCGFAVASPFNFLMHRCFTFRSIGLVQNDLVRYLVMQGANLAVSVGAMALAVDQLHLPYPIGVLTAIVLIPIGTYFVMDQWVFRQQAIRVLPTPQS